METRINGKSVQLEGLGADETAVDVIRHRCGLTGTKLVCGSGVCGACTVRVNGTAMTSCLLPAQQLAGKQIETIEAHSADNLHPMQKAFMVHDGLQCGYCTSGFLMASIAFYDQWRAKHGTKRPSREDVAEALAGHLCRCGAYVGIYEAVQTACTGEFDHMGEVTSQRVDGLAKVTGQAKYTTDIQLEGQLVGKLLRSTHAHAKVKSIDFSAALAIDGVQTAVLLHDLPRTVRYVGQPIAGIAAIDEATAYAALQAIQVNYDVLPHVVGIDNALKPDAPDVWGDAPSEAPSAGEGVNLPGKWISKNVRKGRLNMGGLRPSKARDIAHKARITPNQTLYEASFQNGIQVHTALEPHCAVAHWTSDSTLTVYLSTQAVSAAPHSIAKKFGLNPEDVTVIAKHIGGGFGAKNAMFDEAIAAIKIAKAAQKPVSIIPNRPEEMMNGGFRPGGQFNMQVATNKNHELLALVAHAYSDSGIAVSNITASMTAQAYDGGARDLADHDVVNNHPPGKPFRGPGGPGALWAIEQSIDQIAHEKHTDPITVRRRWTEKGNRLKLYDWVESLDVWQNRPRSGETNGRYRRGVGVAFGQWLYFYDPETIIQLNSSPDGLTVTTGTQDIGNGVRTTLARTVADIFGIPADTVTVKIGNSQYPHGPTAGGSRVTASVFAPTQEAAQLLRDHLFGLTAETLDLNNARLGKGGIDHAKGHISWAEAFAKLPPQQIKTKRGSDPALLQQVGSRIIQLMGMDFLPGSGLAHGAVVAEVEVDTLLGKTRVLRVWENLAIGRVYTPDMARSQVYGGIIQGIGYALYEEKLFDAPSGQNLTSNLQDYRIPAIGDIPEMFVEFTDGGFDHAKGKGIGMSELCTVPVGPAIANAVFNATGVRCYESPIKPERLLMALQEEANA